RRSTLDLGEALRFEPGLQLSRQGGVGEELILRIRGAMDNHTLVLVDGIPVNDGSSYGAGRIAGFDPFTFDRVEIVRGPFSAITGAASMGGVVRLHTTDGGDRSGLRGRLDGGWPLAARAAALASSGEEGGVRTAVFGSFTRAGTIEGTIEDGVVEP